MPCEALWDLVRPCETVGDRAGARSGIEILILSRWDNIENLGRTRLISGSRDDIEILISGLPGRTRVALWST